MAEIIRMPRMSDTMTEGVFVKWLKKIGDTVKSGDVLAEVETDKATMELESFQEGVLLHIGVEAGQAAAIDSIIAILGKQGEDISSILANEKKSDKVATNTSSKSDSNESKPAEKTSDSIVVNDVAAIDGRLKASPLAKNIAKEKGINLSAVQGSGEGGRIVKRDVEQLSPSSKPAVSTSMVVNSGTESFSDTTLTNMRKTIARRLSESKHTAPHFYLTIAIQMDKAIEARKSINAKGDVKISINDLVVKACSVALLKHPTINSSWMQDFIRTNHHVHIGVAVAIEDGLIVPVIKFANTKSLSAISSETKILVDKARNKQLKPDEFSGNTFTISNLGMFGIDEFTAIINPPDACILAVGGISETPIVQNGNIVIGNIMKVTLSCDHRVVDGASGAAFLNTLKELLEEPIKMIV